MQPQPSRGQTDPAVQLSTQLQALRTRLARLTGGCDADTAAPVCLEQLRRYLLLELIPVLHGLRLRVHPALRRLSGNPGRRGAVEHALLLRLAERVVAMDAETADRGSADSSELAALTGELAELVDRLLGREQRILPAMLRRMPPVQARRLLDAAARTAETVRVAPHLDLDPALL